MKRTALTIDKTDGRSLRSGFVRNAAVNSDAVALVTQDGARSYGELDRIARVWAHAILDVLERPAQRIGIFAYRSEVAYNGVLAALYSGAAFVPLNRTFPIERTRAMIRKANLDAIIVDESSSAQLEQVMTGLESCPLLVIPTAEATPSLNIEAQVLAKPNLDEFTPLEALPPVMTDEVAYLLFTSGSTGEPKGVPVTHANVLHFIDVITERYGITAQDRFSQTFDQTFDLSVFDLFVAWERGARVCAAQPLDLIAPARYVAKHGITVWFSVPSVPALMRKKNLLKPDAFPTLRWSLFCGEPLPQASAEAWQVAAPQSVLENLYGPTELTIACFVHRWNTQHSPSLCVNGLVPIGRPFPGLSAVVIDEDFQPILVEEIGELCVSGPQTVPGYWQDPVKTSERFVSLPTSTNTSLRFYRTGDRVGRLHGGDYIYVGRTDNQIKVLGHRVELGEVEAALCRDPKVVQAVAIGYPVEQGTALGITAFVSGAGIETQQLKEEIRKSLPEYMTPRVILTLDAMPLNSNGKVDRNALFRVLEQDEGTT